MGGGCTQFVHGHSRMTIDPRILTMPGRSTSGFHQPGGRGRGRDGGSYDRRSGRLGGCWGIVDDAVVRYGCRSMLLPRDSRRMIPPSDTAVRCFCYNTG